METTYVKDLHGPDLFDGLGPRWEECNKFIEQAFKAAVTKWRKVGFMGCEPFEYQLKEIKEKAKITGSEFIRCEGYSLWFVNDWSVIEFVRKPEGIEVRYYIDYYTRSEENVESISPGQIQQV